MVKIKKKEAKKKPLTRKEQRKQKSEVKKQNKRLYHAGKTNGPQRVAAAAEASAAQSLQGKNKKKKRSKKVIQNPDEIPKEQLLSGEIASDDDESIDSDFSDPEVDALMPKRAKVEVYEPLQGKKARKGGVIQRQDEEAARRKELRQQRELQTKSKKQRLKQLRLENEEEDREINKLEKKLKLNKSKDKNRLVRKMFNDGLDYLLDFVLDDEEEKLKWEEKQERKKRLKEQQEKEEEGMWSDEEDDEERDEAQGNFPEDDSGSEEELDDEDLSGDEEHSEEESEQEEEAPKVKEDIYGRKRDAEGNILPDPVEQEASAAGQKYIPPHQRALMAASAGSSEKQAEILARLLKQCKGLLNRLSEANLHKIAAGIEALYMKNSRFNMNETLTKLLQEALLGSTRTNERMVQEHMVLLAYLHAQIGSEIGAHFLQTFVELFDGYVKDIANLEVEDKQLNNLVLVLCYMYLFKIYELSLLMELIGKLADQLCEKSVECLLLIFQSIGFRLRKNDPLAFKTMMQRVQSQIATAPLELKENPRLRFMVDILNAVKNNNMQKLPQYDPELAENLRKRLKAMLKNDRYVVTLNITLEDLLRADKVGKWWIVGSAWTGNLDEMGSAKQKQDKNLAKTANGGFADQLLELARKQQMNTAERRNIFCIIMSAADYVDAFEKILHLALKDQRAVAYVIIHCALNEKRANPYYAHLALKFCQFNRKYQLAFQFASWDRINDIEKLSRPQIRNLASFLQQVILAAGLQLSVLKVVDFMQLDKLSFYFMKEVMVRLLLAPDEREVYQTFERVAKNTKLQQFKQSVRLFLQHFLLKEDQLEKLKLKEEEQQLLQQRVDHLDKLLAYVDL
ncbi:nucleolar MIF4G domain-containing protein 1 homolog [Drosophila subpulchrella]|uniref:nucleolar MIF4G domain-containing protein 1 homolog n=1 Tax=Drosophila subpulchrella TaxID=1486046 RepID=UPI0018A158FE|nr:nucleolar MIF4G domain-containing protein 1 homolog [Drosophila subpulchrella]